MYLPSFSPCATIVCAAITPAIVLAQPQIASIDDLDQSIIDNSTLGLGVLVTNGGKVLYIAGCGAADHDISVSPGAGFGLDPAHRLSQGPRWFGGIGFIRATQEPVHWHGVCVPRASGGPFEAVALGRHGACYGLQAVRGGDII